MHRCAGAFTEHVWNADPSVAFSHRLGRSPAEPGVTGLNTDCVDLRELDDGDAAVIGRDLTAAYTDRLPPGGHVAADERIVIVPRIMLIEATADIPDA